MSVSRRRLLQGLSYTSACMSLGGLGLVSLPGMAESVAILPSIDAPRFNDPDIIRYDAECFTIHGQDIFIYGACLHYTRVPKELWDDRLDKLKQAGFNTIETYVFWNYHEPVEGQVDMTEFRDFVKAVHKMGLWLIARVGPYVCAEWDAGGFPHWLIAKQFPLRSDHPESIRSSERWYGHVLPIVRENMITRGGPVILVQIENEYDYWHLPNANKLNYMTALAKTAWKMGIDVPLITNWCKQARENSDPVMSQIMDTCDLYPHWDVVSGVVSGLEKLRMQEPTSPISIAELQGGWFSKFGGQLSVNQSGVGGEQYNALTKTVIENCTSFFSIYMGCGGTNFDWAARGLTTTYDYAAPLREHGGIWNKYYAAHRLGMFLNKFGPLAVRAQRVPGAVISDNQNVSVSLRMRGELGILFVRENANFEQGFRLKLSEDAKGSQISHIPYQGKLTITRRGMKLLAINLTLPSGKIHYCTAEVLTYGQFARRSYLIVYDDPGSLVEIALESKNAPRIEGEVLYHHYDASSQRALIGFRMESVQKYFLFNNNLQIVALPQRLADRTWPARFLASNEQLGKEEVVVESIAISNCVWMQSQPKEGRDTAITLYYAPGDHDLTILGLTSATQCTVDGEAARIQRDERRGTVSVTIQTPALPFASISITEGQYWVESFDPSVGEWITTRPVALETLAPLPYSYVKYCAHFEWYGEPKLFVNTLTADEKQVFLNGKRVDSLCYADRSVASFLAGYAKAGTNLLEVSYECFGSQNGGHMMEELKGVSGIHIGNDQKQAEITGLRIQVNSAAMRGREVNPEYCAVPWRYGVVGGARQVMGFMPAYTWFRAHFAVPGRSEWFCPWKLCITADRDALIYVNGKFVGFYRTIGPQNEFYLPESYLHTGGQRENILTVRLAYTESLASLRQLIITPYEEFAARRTEVRL